jgi:hypothetical protein
LYPVASGVPEGPEAPGTPEREPTRVGAAGQDPSDGDRLPHLG